MGLPCRGQPGQRSDQRQAQARGHTRARSASGPHRLLSGLSRPPTLLSGHSLARGSRGLRPDPGDRGRDTRPRWPGLFGATIVEMRSNQTSVGPARNRTQRELRGLVGRAQESGKSSRALVYTCRGPAVLGRGVSGDPASLQGSPLHNHHLVPYPHSGFALDGSAGGARSGRVAAPKRFSRLPSTRFPQSCVLLIRALSWEAKLFSDEDESFSNRFEPLCGGPWRCAVTLGTISSCSLFSRHANSGRNKNSM